MIFSNPRCWSLRAAVVAAALLLVSSPAMSAALGRLAVASALGQPLNAEIEVLSVTPADMATFSARLARPEAYQEAGLEYVADLTGLVLTVVPRSNNSAVVRVTSNAPVVEPVLNLLVEVSWAGGRVQRQYAALLDPPGYGAQVAAAAATPPVLPPPASALPAPVIPMARLPLPPPAPPPAGVPAVAPAPAPPEAATAKPSAEPPPVADRQGPGKAAPARTPRSATEPAASPAPPAGGPGTYGPVRRGETLGKIAQQVAPDGATLSQALAALYAENPSAFIGENMNRLIAGAVLRVPSADEVTAIPPAIARKLLDEHRAGRPATLDELGYVPRSRAAPADAGTARGRVASAVDPERLPAPPAGADTLRLSRGPGEGGPVSAPDRLAGKQDELSAREQTVRDARARIIELQQQIRDVERLLALAAGGQGAGAAAAGGRSGELAVDTLPAPLPAPPGAAPAPTAATSPAGGPVAAPVPPPSAKARPPAPPRPEPTLLDRLRGDLLWAAALVVVGLGIGAILLLRRLQRPATGAPVPNVPKAPKAPGARAAAVPAGRPAAAPTVDDAAFLADLDKAIRAPASSESADPVAEADDLITHGRHNEAAEVLRAALTRNANQPQVALRLLELHHANSDAPGFAQVAEQLRGVVGESSALWRKAAQLGAQIDPGNPLYGDESNVPPPVPLSPLSPPALEPRPAEALAAAASAPSGEGEPDLAPPAPPAEVPPLDFVAGILAEPPKPRLESLPVEPLETDLPLLDLPSLDFAAPPTAPAPPDPTAGLLDAVLGADLSGDTTAAEASADGVGTRLDLAKAYLDIGDKAGARDLLEEVVRSGSPAQSAEAEKLLGSL